MNPAERIAALTPEQRELLSRRLLERTQATPDPAPAELPALPEGPFDPHQPSPLSDIQEVFWMGGSGLFDLGGCSPNVFIEYDIAGVADELAEELARRLNLVLTRAVARHPMLRTVVSADGMQRVLPEVPPYEVELVNLGHLSEEDVERHLESTRERLRYSQSRSDRWPLFDMVVFQLPGERIRYQARFDALIVDGQARTQLLNELVRGIINEQEGRERQDPPTPAVTYLDYVRAVRAFRDSATWERCRAYWHARLPSLPGAPRLPLARDFGPETVPRIAKRTLTVLDPPSWAALCRRAAQRGITPSGIGTAIAAETLRSWSEEPGFLLGLSSTYCPPIHPDIRQVLGTFANLCLLEVEGEAGPFAERAKRLQNRLTADLDHQHYSGYETLRELNRMHRAGGRATLPIQLTSTLRAGASLTAEAEPEAARREQGDELREIDLRIALPQVLLFWVLSETSDKSLFLISQAVEEVFPPDLVADLMDGYRRLAVRLAEDETAWSEPRPLRLPAPDLAAPDALGAGREPALAALFADQVRARPEAPALVTAERTVSYGELDGPPEPDWQETAAALAALRSGNRHDDLEASARELGRLAGLGPGDRLLALSLPGSDLWLCEIFAALTAGAAVVLPAARERTPEALAALAARERVTVWSSAPAVFETALHHMERERRLVPPTLRRVLLHRDRVPAGLPGRLRALRPELRSFATWGIPGAPIAAAGPLGTNEAEAAGSCPLLRPVAGWRLHVLDRDLAPRPAWVPGHLYLSRSAEVRESLESTGERARRLPDDRIELLGKELLPPVEALGYGADPRRIEAALERHPAIRQAVVSRREPEQRLVAWLLLRSGPEPSDAELRRHLRAAGPEHLIPATWVRLNELPLTPEGCVDRSALVTPAATGRPEEAAWSPLTTELAGLWEEVLGRRPASPEDDFYELGGNSLLATRLMGRVAARFGLERQLASFLEHPTVGHLAKLVDRVRAEKAEEEAAKAKPPLSSRLNDSLATLRARFLPRRRGPQSAWLPEGAQESPSVFQEMRPFLILWIGQLVSALGTSLGSFSLGVWVYEKTGSATQFAMIAVLVGVVMLVLAPISGALADRWDRKKIMLFSNAGSAVMTVGLASLMFSDRLQIWQVYPFVLIMVSLAAIQGPAISASVSLLVPRRHLARAAGMSQMSRSAAQIVGPFIAGLLVAAIGYHGVIYIDGFTFLFATAMLLLVRIPSPPRAADSSGAANPRRRSMFGDLAQGWAYIRERPGLFALLSMYALTNFCMGTVQVLLTPLILSFATPTELGSVNSAAATGVFLGSLTLSVWGGPRNRIWTIFAILVFQGCLLFLGGVEPSIPLIALTVFGFMFTSPIIVGSNQAILQSKVAPEVQGRVFGMAAFIVACTVPLASGIAGPLVDRVFQPLLSPGGKLADTFVGSWIGVGPGRGAGLLFVVVGAVVLLIVSFAFLNPRLRRVETELPDVVAAPPRSRQPQ